MDYKTRVAQAVNDEEWQKLRHSLKGTSTQNKLEEIDTYWIENHWDGTTHRQKIDLTNCKVCIQVDNYIKSLCRGGQLHPGESLESALSVDWELDIRK